LPYYLVNTLHTAPWVAARNQARRGRGSWPPNVPTLARDANLEAGVTTGASLPGQNGRPQHKMVLCLGQNGTSWSVTVL